MISKHQPKRILALLLSLAMGASALAGGSAFAAGDSTPCSEVLEAFLDPASNTDAKPMARYWFPDAGAGLTSEQLAELSEKGYSVVQSEEYLNLVSQSIEELYEAGFGGVELTMLADGNNYDNTIASYAGWGTEAWVRVLSQALYTANQVGKGDGTDFKVDITMTAHWPLVIDTVDPNDDEQQQQLTSAIQNISQEDLTAESVTLSLPAQRVKDTFNTINLNDSDRSASFLFTEKLVGATFAVQNADGSLVFDSLTPLTATEQTESDGSYAGYPAGVPGTEYLIKRDGRWQEAQGITEDTLTTITEPIAVDSATRKQLQDVTITTETQVTETPWGQSSTTVYVVTDSAGNDITASCTVLKEGDIASAVTQADGDYYYELQKVMRTDTYGINIPKTDSQGNLYYEDENGRRFMDDWQYLYEVSAADLQEAMDKVGPLGEGQSYVLVNVYREGSGQVTSGGETVTMNNRTYAIDYYNERGVQKVIDFWEDNMLDHEVTVENGACVTLRELMEQNNGSCIFEDSLELNTSGPAFSAYIVDPDNQAGDNAGFEGDWERLLGYEAAPYLPILAGCEVTDDNGMSAKISADFNSVKETLFNNDHSATVSDWAHSFGGGYRFQSSSSLSEALNVDIVEADNGTLSGDGIRTASSTVNVRGDQYLSMEAITSTTLDPTYYETMLELNMNFSGGINRVILHGTPFKQSVTGWINEWPGWAFANEYWGSGYGAWNSRQAFWDDIDTFSDYVTRVQGLLQQGTTQIPVLIVGGSNKDVAFQNLLDSGYHYNVAAEETLMMEEASPENVVDGVLSPDGLATQVLVLNNLTSVSDVAFIDRLCAYADKGMDIVIYGSTDLGSVQGVQATDLPGSGIPADKTDAAAQAAYEKLLANANVHTGIADEAALLSFLDSHSDNTVRYDQSGLETTHLVDHSDGTDYYFLYNNHSDGKISYGNVGVGLDLTRVTGLDIDTTLTLDCQPGESVYQLDSYTGEVTQLTRYTSNGDGTISLPFQLAAWDTVVLAVSDNAAAFEKAGAQVQSVKEEGETIDLTEADWNLTIDSYGPTTDLDPSAPFYETTVRPIDAGSVKLGLWDGLNQYITDEQLAAVGITADKQAEAKIQSDKLVSYLSGVGTYTTTVDWAGGDGAYFSFDHRDASKTGDAQVNIDMVTELTVTNAQGKTTTFSNINPQVNKIDLGNALSKGSNTIRVKLVTTLRNREALEGACVKRYTLSSYGLTAASITPYSTLDTSILDKVLSYAESVIASGEVDNAIGSVQDRFTAAYNQAKAVATSPASQQEIDSAWVELMNAIHLLGLQAGDKQALDKLIEVADGLDLALYADGTAKDNFTAALAAAHTVSADRDALSADVAQAQDALLDALVSLRFKADKSVLEQVLAAANSIDLSAYTVESAAVFRQAKADAETVNADNTLSEDNQAQVDAAVDALREAIDRLTPAGSDTAPVTGDDAASVSSGSPKTGDAAPFAAAAAVLLAGASLFALKKHRAK